MGSFWMTIRPRTLRTILFGIQASGPLFQAWQTCFTLGLWKELEDHATPSRRRVRSLSLPRFEAGQTPLTCREIVERAVAQGLLDR